MPYLCPDLSKNVDTRNLECRPAATIARQRLTSHKPPTPVIILTQRRRFTVQPRRQHHSTRLSPKSNESTHIISSWPAKLPILLHYPGLRARRHLLPTRPDPAPQRTARPPNHPRSHPRQPRLPRFRKDAWPRIQAARAQCVDRRQPCGGE